MEWIDGEPLSALLHPAINRGGLPLGLAVQIVVQTCKAMQAIHSLRGPDGRPLELVHAELAPRHLMIDASGTVKCIDLGMASGSRSDLRPDPRADVSLLAPERELGRALDSRADVFSLGALLYLLTTGKHPDREGPSIVRPSAVSENYPMGLEWVVLQALARQPEQRFQSAGEMLDELVAALPGHASEIELATYVQNVCASSFAHRRNIVHGSLRRSFEESAERIPLADRTSEPSPNTLSPAVLESSQPLSRTSDWKPLPLALAAAATTFVAGFTWTLVGTGVHTPPTSKPSAAQQAPSAGRPLASAPTSPELLPRSVPILQAPAETTSSAPALPSVQPPSPPKKPKPPAPRQRYGI
jgi:serine/threonine-protein kinase